MSNKRIRHKYSTTTKTMDEYEKHILNLIHEKRKELSKLTRLDEHQRKKMQSELHRLFDMLQHLRIFQLK